MYVQLTSSKLSSLTTIANGSSSMRHHAKAILHFYYHQPLIIEKYIFPQLRKGNTNTQVSANINNTNQNIVKVLGISPNPANNKMNILLSNDENTNIELYDIYGKLVLKSALQSGSIDVSVVSSGIYQCKVFFGNQLIDTKKVAIVR